MVGRPVLALENIAFDLFPLGISSQGTFEELAGWEGGASESEQEQNRDRLW